MKTNQDSPAPGVAAVIRIDSPRFGALEVSADRIIEFPRGMPGFESLRRFFLFHPEGGDEPRYFVLQSIDDPSIAFHLADPALFGFDYEIMLPDDDAVAIGLTDPTDAVVAVILVRDGSTPLRANLNAPLIINTRTRRGLQHVLARAQPETEAPR